MATSVQILNTIRDNASKTYQERIPQATRDNLGELARTVASYPDSQNEFLNLLINRIAMVIVNNKLIKNPLARLKSGQLPMGQNIEEIIVNPSIAETFDYKSTDLLKVIVPDVKALYYGINRQDKYAVTITQVMIQRAFTNDSDMSSLISQIVNSLYSGDNYDEFLLTKGLVKRAVDSNHIIKDTLSFDIENMTKENTLELLRKIKSDSLYFTFPSSKYNSYKVVKPVEDKGKDVITFTPTSEQVLLIDASVYTNISIDVLASAFNMSQTEFESIVIPVDDFGGAPVLAVLCDKTWYKIYDTFKYIARNDFGDTASYKYWLHHHQVIQYSMFANAKAYLYTPKTV